MARIRTIKPDFFLDSELSKLDPRVRLFFIGIWTKADKAGRVKEDQNKLKVQILPWDDISAEECLASLHPKFIQRYKVAGEGLIQVRNWHHQRPHHTETESLLPPPITDIQPLYNRQEGKGREGKEVCVGLPEASTTAPEREILSFPIKGPKKEWLLLESKLRQYQEAYKGLPVLEIMKK